MTVTLAGVEELDLFPSEEARQQAIKEHADSIRGWGLALGIAICAGATLVFYVFVRNLLIPTISRLLPWGLPVYLHEPLRFALIAAFMFFMIRALHRWGVRRELRNKLLKLNVPVCMKCGYLLRGLPTSTPACPECGRAIDDVVRDILARSAVERKVE